MSGSADSSRRSGYDALAAGIEAGRLGHFDRALEAFDEAMAWAHESGDERLRDRVLCNRCGAEFELGRIDGPRRQLRRTLLRSSDPENRFLAAYTIARSYELQKDAERALFYARLARDYCLSLQRPDWLASSHNQTGNLLLASSYVAEACQDFELAMKLMPMTPSVERALILDNLGYCRLLQGRYREGFLHLFECLRTLIHFGVRRYQPPPRLSLAFGHLELGKLQAASRHALVARDLAKEHGDDTSIKNSLFLLGEIYNQAGRGDLAHQFFTELQRTYYPEAANAADLLMAVDVRPLINLKAL